MFYKKVIFRNFRNISNYQFEFNENGNVFLGNNGVGKTNILEGIHCLSIGKSQKNANDKEMVNVDSDFFRLIGQGLLKNGADIQIDIIYEKNAKKILRINDNKQNNLSDLVGNIGIVSFSPEDTIITTGSPSHRRKFLNVVLSQISHRYLKNLQDYRDTLKQRNSILKRYKDTDKKRKNTELMVWSEKLVQLGTKLIIQREQIIKDISRIANEFYAKISHEKSDLSIQYSPSIDFEELDEDRIGKAFMNKLEENTIQEYEIGYTLCGPQRDNIKIFLNDMDLRSYGSQGQHRTVCIALRLAESRLLTQKMGENPIILMDDVFSELDLIRTNSLMKMFNEFGQVFLATPREEDLNKCPSSFQVYKIKDKFKVDILD